MDDAVEVFYLIEFEYATGGWCEVPLGKRWATYHEADEARFQAPMPPKGHGIPLPTRIVKITREPVLGSEIAGDADHD